jgi:hypothetical protein
LPLNAGSNPAPANQDTFKERSPDPGDLVVFLVMPNIGTTSLKSVQERINE